MSSKKGCTELFTHLLRAEILNYYMKYKIQFKFKMSAFHFEKLKLHYYCRYWQRSQGQQLGNIFIIVL